MQLLKMDLFYQQFSDQVLSVKVKRKINERIDNFVKLHYKSKRINFARKLFYEVVKEIKNQNIYEDDQLMEVLFNSPSQTTKIIIKNCLQEYNKRNALFLFSFENFRQLFFLHLKNLTQDVQFQVY